MITPTNSRHLENPFNNNNNHNNRLFLLIQTFNIKYCITYLSQGNIRNMYSMFTTYEFRLDLFCFNQYICFPYELVNIFVFASYSIMNSRFPHSQHAILALGNPQFSNVITVAIGYVNMQKYEVYSKSNLNL